MSNNIFFYALHLHTLGCPGVGHSINLCQKARCASSLASNMRIATATAVVEKVGQNIGDKYPHHLDARRCSQPNFLYHYDLISAESGIELFSLPRQYVGASVLYRVIGNNNSHMASQSHDLNSKEWIPLFIDHYGRSIDRIRYVATKVYDNDTIAQIPCLPSDTDSIGRPNYRRNKSLIYLNLLQYDAHYQKMVSSELIEQLHNWYTTTDVFPHRSISETCTDLTADKRQVLSSKLLFEFASILHSSIQLPLSFPKRAAGVFHNLILGEVKCLYRLAHFETRCKNSAKIPLELRGGQYPVKSLLKPIPAHAAPERVLVLMPKCTGSQILEGAYIFPRDVLIEKNIFSNLDSGIRGKSNLNLYVPTTELSRSNSINSQKWQSEYYVDLSLPQSECIPRIQSLLGLK